MVLNSYWGGRETENRIVREIFLIFCHCGEVEGSKPKRTGNSTAMFDAQQKSYLGVKGELSCVGQVGGRWGKMRENGINSGNIHHK